MRMKQIVRIARTAAIFVELIFLGLVLYGLTAALNIGARLKRTEVEAEPATETQYREEASYREAA
jgi:hypothetical protein